MNPLDEVNILYVDDKGTGYHTWVKILEILDNEDCLAYSEDFKCRVIFWEDGNGDYIGVAQP